MLRRELRPGDRRESSSGFDAVANSAEESKTPQRDLPLGIMGNLLICIALYVFVCLALTGMVSYKHLGEEAPLSEAFKSMGLKYVSVLRIVHLILILILWFIVYIILLVQLSIATWDMFICCLYVFLLFRFL